MISRLTAIPAFWLSLAVASIPSLTDHVLRVWQHERYHYLPALALAIGLLLWYRWDRKWHAPSGPLGWSLLATGVLLFLFALLSGSSWLGAAAFLCFLGAWLGSHYEAEPAGSLIPIWPASWMLLPLPLGYDASLASSLQLRSSRLSSYSLDLLEVPHVLFGNVLQLQTGKLFVEEACSGVQSLFTVLFVSVFLVIAFRRSLWLLPAYILAAIFWAGMMNVVRIVSIAYASDRFGWDLAHGWQHAILGYVCLALAILCLLSTDRLFRVLAFPVENTSEQLIEANPLVYWWNRLLWTADAPSTKKADEAQVATQQTSGPSSLRFYAICGIACFALLIGTAQLWRLTLGQAVASEPSVASGSRLFLETNPSIATDIEGFSVVEHEVVEGSVDQPFGRHADVWKGEYKGLGVTLALSQPYSEWHDLCVCYTGIGLKLNERTVSNTQTKTPEWNFVSARLVADDGTVTYLWFSAFDRSGKPVLAPDGDILTRWISRLQAGDSLLRTSRELSEIAIIQLMVQSQDFLAADQVEALEELHLSSRRLFKQTTTNSSESQNPS